MEEYIVSARKYRPLTFDSVVGQQALTITLKNAISSGKLAHAYLFCGPRGVGKTTCARIFAKSINCTSPLSNGDACGQCESCKAFDEQRSMCIQELDAASNNTVDDIRELCKQVMIPPQGGKYKVFIIDEVHMLTPAAFNAFLKTLEEPPSYVIFILATTEKHRILPTILSRCQVYDFQRITNSDIIEHLKKVADKEGYHTDIEALNLIANKADGGMRDALSIFDQMVSFTEGDLSYQKVSQSLNVLNIDYYFRLVQHFVASEIPPCLLLLNEILQKGYEGSNFISGLATHLRNLLVARDASTLALLEMSEQMKQKYKEQAMSCKPRFLYRAIKLCNDCAMAYKTSNNKRLQLEICLIQVAQLNEEDTPEAGRRPAKTLKPIFEALMAKGQGTSVQTQSESVSKENPTDDVHTPPAARISAHMVPPVTGTAHNIISHFRSSSESNTGSTKSALRRVSFRNTHSKSNSDTESQNIVSTQNLLVPLELDRLRVAWQKYVSQMPDNKVAMKQRMKSMQPMVVDQNTFSITVGNPQVRSELESMRTSIEGFIRSDQRNSQASMLIHLVEMEQKVSYNKKEHLQILMTRNPLLSQLINEVQLELE